MKEVLGLFVQILLLRRGPQDLPASGLLLSVTVAAYVGVNSVISSVFPPAHNWPALLLVDVGFTLLWTALLLRVAGRRERTLQTTTAVFGYQLVLAPLLVPWQWLAQQFQGSPAWQGPLALIWTVVLVWVVAANARIIRSALEWSFTASAALVIAQTFADQLLQMSILVPVKS
jgi:hypothetical protein